MYGPLILTELLLHIVDYTVCRESYFSYVVVVVVVSGGVQEALEFQSCQESTRRRL
jgi:hypothetical protein